MKTIPPFARRVAEWQRAHGRNTLPWQNTHDPYRIWLSEIMLQQTQVATVIPYYERFLARFPTVADLAAADEGTVMALWAGLGYYTRARNLHACARRIMADWNGRFPPTAAQIETLPGIGRSTAAAIAAFAYGERSPILDGNVKRVFARHFGIEGDPTTRAVEQRMWGIAQGELPPDGPDAADEMRRYTQGLMDLGATVCTRGDPNCGQCPVRDTCVALREARQHELPTPRVRKASPERYTQMLVIEKAGEVLVQRRPAPGIWGGLWSLPEFDDGDADTACRALGVGPIEIVCLPAFSHAFTHFKLHVVPWHVKAGPVRLKDDAGEPPRIWLPTSDLAGAALPAPVKKLLQGLYRRGGLF
ncbi:A/G-specific adenine glycosylase [uncultured Pigmentiphaga sp.]|jgi:A/G-specific adenine glycosylase|uniref:A/G-specific adenine glycosylase n=1 Tax=uncultured Pigmentiphaga sp. TaxID=340361 RepID=UPI002606B6C6|nr:A/G-specific adenine glycosylase [uncultured Pigmentiphaga sp.]